MRTKAVAITISGSKNRSKRRKMLRDGWQFTTMRQMQTTLAGVLREFKDRGATVTKVWGPLHALPWVYFADFGEGKPYSIIMVESE